MNRNVPIGQAASAIVAAVNANARAPRRIRTRVYRRKMRRIAGFHQPF